MSVKYLAMSLQTELFKLLFGEYDGSSFESSSNELSSMATRLFFGVEVSKLFSNGRFNTDLMLHVTPAD